MHSKAGILATASWTEQELGNPSVFWKGHSFPDSEMWIAEGFGEAWTAF